MEHLLLKAATTAATDEGIFEAVISTATADRDGDVVAPAAMVTALAKWAALGKLVPLAYTHTDEVVGHVDPATVRAKDGEVIARGWVDQATPRGEEVWRLVKSGTLSFSFGYLIPEGGAVPRAGGRWNIKELDVFEISAVPVGPANNDTRVLSYKTAEELRQEAKRVAREVEEVGLPDIDESPPATPDPDPTPDLAQEIQEIRSELAETRKALENQKTAEELRREADRVAREVEAQQLPDVPTAPDVKTSAPAVDVTEELQEVKAQLAAMRQQLEDLKTKQADVADEGTKSRSADPLRQQADAVALEVASGFKRPPEPPPTPAPTPPDLVPLGELKRQMRDEMLGVLSGGITQ